MHIKITSPKKYKNSVRSYVVYLEKENDISLNESFFNQYDNNINPEEVIQNIDRKNMHLKRKEAHYYSIFISPSQKELEHIKHNASALREYTRSVMKTYANNFNREGINENTIVWYGKIEHHRKMGSEHPIVDHNRIYDRLIKDRNDTKDRKLIAYFDERIRRMGGKYYWDINKKEVIKLKASRASNFIEINEKSGKKIVQLNQEHIHVVVSRKDVTNRISISPLSKGKQVNTILNGKEVKIGFNRNEFAIKCEQNFDLKFGNKREIKESILYFLRKNDPFYKSIFNEVSKKYVLNIEKDLKLSLSKETNSKVELLKQKALKSFVSGALGKTMNTGFNQCLFVANLIKNKAELKRMVTGLLDDSYSMFKNNINTDGVKNIIQRTLINQNFNVLSDISGMIMTPQMKITQSLISKVL